MLVDISYIRGPHGAVRVQSLTLGRPVAITAGRGLGVVRVQPVMLGSPLASTAACLEVSFFRGLFQDWALGVLYTKITCAITMMGPNWWLKEALEQVRRVHQP